MSCVVLSHPMASIYTCRSQAGKVWSTATVSCKHLASKDRRHCWHFSCGDGPLPAAVPGTAVLAEQMYSTYMLPRVDWSRGAVGCRSELLNTAGRRSDQTMRRMIIVAHYRPQDERKIVRRTASRMLVLAYANHSMTAAETERSCCHLAE